MTDARCQKKVQDIDAVLQCKFITGHTGRHVAVTSSGFETKWEDPVEKPRGVWVVWDHGEGKPVIRMVFQNEIDALREANAGRMMEKVDFLPYGREFVPK